MLYNFISKVAIIRRSGFFVFVFVFQTGKELTAKMLTVLSLSRTFSGKKQSIEVLIDRPLWFFDLFLRATAVFFFNIFDFVCRSMSVSQNTHKRTHALTHALLLLLVIFVVHFFYSFFFLLFLLLLLLVLILLIILNITLQSRVLNITYGIVEI